MYTLLHLQMLHVSGQQFQYSKQQYADRYCLNKIGLQTASKARVDIVLHMFAVGEFVIINVKNLPVCK